MDCLIVRKEKTQTANTNIGFLTISILLQKCLA